MVIVVRGPYMAAPAAFICLPFIPVSLSPGHIPQIDPTAKFVSITEDPSKGSKATEYPLPPMLSERGERGNESAPSKSHVALFSADKQLSQAFHTIVLIS